MSWPSLARAATPLCCCSTQPNSRLTLTSLAAQQQCFDAVTVNNARILGLDGYGLDVGCRADAVLLQARSPEEALRLRATRLLVLRGGRVVSRMAPAVAELQLPGRPGRVDYTRQTVSTPVKPAG